MEKEYKINPLPVLTWNRLDLNIAKMEFDSGAFRKYEGKASGKTESVLPEGLRYVKDMDPSEFAAWVEAHGGAAPREAVVAGKYPMVSDQAFPTGMGAAIDGLLTEQGTDVSFYELEEGVKLREPVRLDHLYPDGVAAFDGLLIRLGKYSEMTLIQFFGAEEESGETGSSTGLVGSSTRVLLEEGAKLHLIKVQMLPKGYRFFDDSGVRLMRDAQLEVTQLQLGAAAVYLGAYYDQWGDRSGVKSRLGYICGKDSLIDHNHVDCFRGKKTEGEMRFHGVLLENAHKVSRETLDFRKDCTDAVGDEEENMLVLGEEAIDRANPMILGEEEAMSGRHAVTVGKLSPEMLFYMQSRGIDGLTAQQLMVRAAVNRVSQHIPDAEIREAAERYVDRLFCLREDCSAPCV